MQTAIFCSQLISSLAFLFYGLLCLFSEKMVAEFERYGLRKFRVLTGTLEVSGALGQLVGFMIPQLLTVSSLGLAMLMICGIATRLRIRDPWFSFLPALILFIVNVFLSFA